MKSTNAVCPRGSSEMGDRDDPLNVNALLSCRKIIFITATVIYTKLICPSIVCALGFFASKYGYILI